VVPELQRKSGDAAMVVNRRSQRVETPWRNALIAAWLASIATAFVSGCSYSFFMEHGYVADYVMAIAKGDRSAWTVLLLVGGTTAAFASVVSAFILAFVWRPLCRLALSRNVTSAIAYVSLGVLVSIVVAAAISLIQYFSESLMPRDYLFQVVAILCCGLTASLTFWSMVRADLKKGLP